jgi:hypothetical protein
MRLGSGIKPTTVSTEGRIFVRRVDDEGTLESSLYLPVKRFLEQLGFEVKGEVCGCDLVALDAGSPAAVVIGELKLTFTLDLVLQAVDRSAACDEIWLAVRASRQGRGRENDRRVRKLCRLLGFGLLAVAVSGRVDVLVEPVPWRPRRDGKRRSRIVDEHRRRRGDPVAGGSTRQPIMTAYRQQALACAVALARAPARPRDLKANIPDAPKILLRNVFNWFVRVERGVYALSEGGAAALVRWKAYLEQQDELVGAGPGRGTHAEVQLLSVKPVAVRSGTTTPTDRPRRRSVQAA